MTTLTPETVGSDRTDRSRTWLFPLIVVLALLGLAAGLWAVLGSDETDEQAVATELVDTWIRSGGEWVRSGDEQAAEELRSVFTDDARLTLTASTMTVEQHVSNLAAGATTNVRRVSELAPAGEGVFTCAIEFDWGGSRWSGELEIELDGDLISRIQTTRDHTEVGSAAAAATDTPADVPSVSFREGDVPGVRVWQLPDAPGGYRPDQSWLAVGSDRDGSIYISGHDHRLNSMLYRLDPETGYLTWVGDARTASTAADNWEPGETAEKFHTRPTYHDGRVYVATLDKSSIDDAFLSTRGFHWYAYDLASGDFVDLSADEPGGVGAEHLQVVTISADAVNDRVYGVTIPENRLLYYDVEEGRTTVVGAPDEWQGYFYSNRFMWTDSRGSVYVTGGTERSQWNQGEDRDVLDSVWRYTPDSGFEDTGYALQTLGAIEVGQWNSAHDTLYVSDDMGHIYRFTDATATWAYLGRPDFPAGETSSGLNKVWVFQLDPGEETIYLGRSDNSGRPNEIWEFDIDSGSSSILATLPDLDTPAGSEAFITGYDSWDRDGSFYISAFSMYDSENAYLIGLDPEQIRSSNASD